MAARELFHEATEDVDAGRFAIALEKFKRVAAVKETAAVRFNIGRCEESLGKTGAALADLELAEREAKLDAKGDEIEKLARDRATTLRPKVPRLTVRAPDAAISGLAVTLDGGRLTQGTLGVGLPIDPGEHVVEANAPGHKPFRAQVQLQAGEAKQVQLALEEGADSADAGAPGASSTRHTWGWIAVGGGVALGGASVVFALLERSAVNDMTAACPTSPCPTASGLADADSARSRAVVDRGLSIGFAAGAVVAVGVGVYLLLTKSEPTSTSTTAVLAPGAPGAPAGFTLHATF